MDDKQSTLTRFEKVALLSENECRQILEKNKWNLEEAYRSFFSMPHQEPPELAPIFGLYGGLAGSLPLQGTKVFAKVVDFIADVDVSQRFINTADQPIEATLKFRQHKAILCGFEIQVDGKKIKGECKEKEEAQNTYDDAIASSNIAYLASTGSDDTFNVKIGNLPPGSQCILTIKYLMELEFLGDFLVLPFPVLSLPVTPVKNSQPHEYKTQVPDGLQVDATFEMSHNCILSINCYSHPIQTKIEKKKASLKGENLVNGSKFIALINLEDPHHPRAVLEVTDPGNEAAIMVSLFPDRFVTVDDVLNEIIFLVDRSGSMSGSRIDQAKSALQLFLRALPLGTMFNIWGFGSNDDQMYPNSTKFDEDSLNYATHYVSCLSANLGGTELLPPLKKIFSKPVDPNFPRQVFVLTDGEVSNTHQVLSFVKQNCGRSTRVFSFGIGGASEALVSGIARYGNGRAVYTNYGDRLETIVMKQLQDALQPVLKNIEVDWGTLPVSKRPVPYIPPPLFHGDMLVLYGFLESGKDLPKQTEICVKGTTGSQIFTWTIPLSTLHPVPGTTVHKLTAHNILYDLQKTNPETHKKEIIELAKKWELASQFTSFVAVSEQEEATGREMKIIEISEVEPSSSYYTESLKSYGYSKRSMLSNDSDLKIKEIQSLLAQNMESLVLRGESIGSIYDATESLSEQSAVFRSTARKTFSIGNVFSSIGNTIEQGFSSIGSSISSLFSSPPPDVTLSLETPVRKDEDTVDFAPTTTTTTTVNDYVPTSFVKPKSSTPSLSLDTFILLQKASGIFVLNDDFEVHLKRSRTNILNAIPTILVELFDEKRRECIWVSALALVHLRRNFPELVQDWTMLADKTIKFLKREIGTESTFEQVMIEAEKFYDKT